MLVNYKSNEASFLLEKYVDAENILLNGLIDPYNKSNKNIPNNADSYYLLGRICMRINRLKDAEYYLKTCVSLDTLHYSAFNLLIQLNTSLDEDINFCISNNTDENDNNYISGLQLNKTIEEPILTPLVVKNTKLDMIVDEDKTLIKGKKNLASMMLTTGPKSKPEKITFASPSVENTPMVNMALFPQTNKTNKNLAFASIGTKLKPSQNDEINLSETNRIISSIAYASRLKSTFNCNEALEIYLELPTQFINSGWIQVQIAMCYFESSNYQKAISHFQLARRYSPYILEGMEYYSSALWQLRKKEDLSILAHQLQNISPHSIQTCIACGNIYSLEKDHDAALKYFQKAVNIDPFNAYVHTLVAHEFVFNDEIDKALQSYRHALRLNERLYNTWHGIGSIYSRQEKHSIAIYHFQKACDIHPYNSVLLSHLGMALNANKETERAVDVLTRASELEQVPSHAHFQLASVLLTLNRFDDAIDTLEIVLRYAPKEAAVYLLLGKIHMHLGNQVKAMSYYNIAVDLDPKDINQVKSQIEKMPKCEINDLNFDSSNEDDDGILHDSDVEANEHEDEEYGEEGGFDEDDIA